jgi:hypothetical protein
MSSIAALAVIDTAMIMLVGKWLQQNGNERNGTEMNRTEWKWEEAVGKRQGTSSVLYYAPRTVPCSSPFKIVKKLGEPGKEVLYELDQPHQWRCHLVFNAVLLSPYRETGEHGPNYLKPPLDLINWENKYEVETIIAHWKRGTSYQYLIRWKGYGSNDDTWEPASNLSNAEEILDEYKTTQSLDEPINPKSKAPLLSPSCREHCKHSTHTKRS